MPRYLLLHRRSALLDVWGPVLAEAWRRSSFLPCLPCAEEWRTAALRYASRYHLDPEEELLLPRLERLSFFDRALWRHVAGELLLVGAVDIPELPAHLESLVHLLPRPVGEQALCGTRELLLGAVPYRREHAGLNDSDDVARLADALSRCPSDEWQTGNLAALVGDDEEEQAEELAFAQEWLGVLREVYAGAKQQGLVVVSEDIC